MSAFGLLSDLCQFGWITEFGKVQVSQEKRTDLERKQIGDTSSERKQTMQLG